MPKATYSINMTKLRRTTIKELKATIQELPTTDANPAVLEQFSKRLDTLLDMYLGTLPPTYRGGSK